MSIFSNTTVTSFTLNIISSVTELITLFISVCLLFFIIYRLLTIKYHGKKFKISAPIVLSINTLCFLIAKSTIQILDVNLNALRRDLNHVIERNDSFFCHFRGYTFFSLVSALYWSNALQAIFHYTRILYPRLLKLHRSVVYLFVFISGQIILAFSSVLPNLLVFNGIHLIPDEIYCTVVMNDFPSLIYLFLVVFGLPLCTIKICYVFLIYKMRHMSFKVRYHRRNRRDYLVIRRIMIIVVILSVASFPAIIDLIIYRSHDHLDPLIYRIEWISASVNALIFAISLPFVNSQLYSLIRGQQAHKRPKTLAK